MTDMGMGQGLVGCLFLVRESNHKKTKMNPILTSGWQKKKKNRAKQLCLLSHTQSSFYANKGTLVGGISCSGLLALLICLLSFEDGWDSNETNGDSLEPWELATAGPLCGLSGLWGTRSVFRGDAWGTMSPCESEAKMVLKSTSIGSPLELCNQHNLIGNNIENDSIHVHGTDGPNDTSKTWDICLYLGTKKKNLSSMWEFNYSQFLTNSPLKIFQLGIGWVGLAWLSSKVIWNTSLNMLWM